MEKFIRENYANDRKAAKEFRSNCKAWCLAVGSNLEALANTTLGDSYPNMLSAYLALLDRTRPDRRGAGKNVRTAASKLRATFQAMLASQALPADFNGAFRQAMDSNGYTPAQLNRILKDRYFHAERPTWYGSQLWGWYDGTAGPGKSWKGDSRVLLQRCEEALGLEPNALISRAYRSIKPIALGTFTVIPYRQARSAQWSANYALREIPAHLLRIFNAYVDWRHQEQHFIDGEYVVVEGRSLWTKPATVAMVKGQFLRYFGWLCLPAPERPLNDLTPRERWQTGKGMQPPDVRMKHLLDLKLVGEFIEFQRFRQHNHVLTKTHLGLLMQINAFVSMRYSFLTAHPELAEDFGLHRPDTLSEWRNQIEILHRAILRLLSSVRRKAEMAQRNPDDPLRHVMSQEAPYAAFLEMIMRLEQAPPLRANVQTWALWARDVALFRMESEIPLRPKNIVQLALRRNVHRDPNTGLWRIFVPKSDLKNFYSGHAEDINRAYSEATSKAITRYVDEARGHLVGAEQSDWLFLGAAAGRRANLKHVEAIGFQVSMDLIYNAASKHLTAYFGESQGITIMRHVIATSILKDDPTQVDAAAAVLNNSPNSVRMNYKHLTQSDGLRRADGWFDRQRNRKQK